MGLREFFNIEHLGRGRVLLFIFIILVLSVLPPLPETVVDSYSIYLIAWIMIMGILAQSYNIVLGSTGLLSFGHAAFFGGGAYATALLLKYTQLKSMLLVILFVFLITAGLAMIIGAITLRSEDIYYSLLTLALAQMIFFIVDKSFNITGGSQGMRVERPTFLGFNLSQLPQIEFVNNFFYYFVLFLFTMSMILLWLVINSPFGLSLNTIRENKARARASGLPVNRYQWYATVISGAFSGLAGALFAIQFGHVSPSETLNWTVSGEILFMTLLGGVTSFIGPIIGAASYILIKEYAVGFISEYWRFIMGAVFLALVLTVKERGIVGGSKLVMDQLWTQRGDRIKHFLGNFRWFRNK